MNANNASQNSVKVISVSSLLVAPKVTDKSAVQAQSLVNGKGFSVSFGSF